ncbi:hypothetical protein ACLB1G_18735 [Oxalobacteraceae bacterium A2-2]
MKTSEDTYKNRFRILHKLYQLTGGVAGRQLIDIPELAAELAMPVQVALETFVYLKNEDLTVWTGFGGKGTITPMGVREVERALSNKRMGYFPTDIAAQCGV